MTLEQLLLSIIISSLISLVISITAVIKYRPNGKNVFVLKDDFYRSVRDKDTIVQRLKSYSLKNNNMVDCTIYVGKYKHNVTFYNDKYNWDFTDGKGNTWAISEINGLEFVEEFESIFCINKWAK